MIVCAMTIQNYGGIECRVDMIKLQILHRFILEMIKDKAIVIMECE